MMKLPEAIRRQFQAWGSIGGKKSSGNMSARARSRRAKLAVTAREAKKHKK